MHLVRSNRNIVAWCEIRDHRKEKSVLKGFTSKISRLENLNDYDSMRKTEIYCLERRRCKNYVIKVWKITGICKKNLKYEVKYKEWKESRIDIRINYKRKEICTEKERG